jgi:ElaA protein
MNIEWRIKRFETLSLQELYEMLRLRSEVFVVEQNCVYQDLDGKDHKALHLIGENEGKIVAYARLFKPNDYFAQASIGRVVVTQEDREKKLDIF